MGMMQDTGSSQLTNLVQGDDVAILMDDHVDKYHPGIQTFKLQSITGLQPNTTVVTTQEIDISRILNEDTSFLSLPVNKAACVKLKLPREHTRNFPKKFIPVGTRFLVSYTGGDISKPVIVGREFDDEIEDEIVDPGNSEEEE